MNCVRTLLLFVCMLSTAPLFAEPLEKNLVQDGFDVAESDWPWWRGPQRNGSTSGDQALPTEFSRSKNVLWRTPLPGRGHSSPTLFGKQLFIATADETSGAQKVHAIDRNTGTEEWQTVVHEAAGLMKNKRSTMASSTVACDGEHVFVCFPNDGQLVASALNLQGELAWQTPISKYVVHQGYGSSPALYQHLVIVSADNKSGGAIAALNRTSGEIVWKRVRPEEPNYPSPILVHVNGKDQLIMVGCNQIVSYDPLTGNTNWETAGATTECVTSTLTDGNLVYTSGGYPENHMSAVRADGSGELVWKNKSRLYVPSLVIHEGYLYGVLDEGIAKCWNAATGEEMWKKRLGGNFSSSPVLVGNRIFVSNESGEFFIYKADPDAYSPLAKNQLGDNVFSTPTIVGGRIYHRVGEIDEEGTRQEALYCIGSH